MNPEELFTHSTITEDDARSFGSTMSPDSHDPNVLFGVLAREAGLISAEQLVDGLTGLVQRLGKDLGEVLVRRGYLEKSDCDRLQTQVDQYVVDHPLTNDANAGDLSAESSPATDSNLAALESLDDSTQAEKAEPGDSSSTRLQKRFVHGEGGIGQVWMARDRVLGRDIALKELKPERASSPAARTRFLREVQITAQLQHPGTVPVYEFHDGADDGRCYYTMKFLKGRTLSATAREYHELRRAGKAGIGELIELLNMFDQVCDTISYAHSRGILHRDMKGENVLVGEYGEVVVIDWGLAKRLGELEEEDSSDERASIDLRHADGLQTMQGEPVGTPAFMSPEQAMGETSEYDERTDVYGLAAVLYEILTGMPPFVGQDLTSVLMAVCTQTPNRPGLINPDVPPELEGVCLRGLSKDQDDRQQSAAELADGVSQWISQQAESSRTTQEREQFFRMSLDVLAVIDDRGQFKQVNPAFVNLLGYTPEDLATLDVFDIIHPDDVASRTETFQRVLQGEPLRGLVRRMLCKDGSVRWLEWHLTKLGDERLIYGVGRDMTRRIRREQMLHALLATINKPIVVIGEDGDIRTVDERAEKLFGFRRENLVGQSAEQIFPEGIATPLRELVAEFNRSESSAPATHRMTARNRAGKTLPVDVTMTPLKTDKGVLISAVVQRTE